VRAASWALGASVTSTDASKCHQLAGRGGCEIIICEQTSGKSKVRVDSLGGQVPRSRAIQGLWLRRGQVKCRHLRLMRHFFLNVARGQALGVRIFSSKPHVTVLFVGQHSEIRVAYEIPELPVGLCASGSPEEASLSIKTCKTQ
jgi:hypothetical protein